jgi:redox-sensitive bicupin YhaK (pirin superfamily)
MFAVRAGFRPALLHKENPMSWNPALEPHCPTGDEVDAIETVIVPRARDIGGFEVRRALPAAERQMVGPFIFFDQMGPAEFLTDQGIDVRPHPHIGLATVTYLYQGSILHRDSLGTRKEIHPGDVNWMIAGQGITHSERTAPSVRAQPRSSLFGIQTWVALPDNAEEAAPGFEHRGKADLPLLEGEGKQIRLILGTAYGETAPVSTFSEMFYADAILDAGARLPMPDNHEDRGLYVLEGEIEIAGQSFDAGKMAIFRPGDLITIHAVAASRVMLLGGETFSGLRYIWWNFVASSKEKIEAAKQAWREGDWQHGRFQLPPDDMNEFIPLPD